MTSEIIRSMKILDSDRCTKHCGPQVLPQRRRLFQFKSLACRSRPFVVVPGNISKTGDRILFAEPSTKLVRSSHYICSLRKVLAYLPSQGRHVENCSRRSQ